MLKASRLSTVAAFMGSLLCACDAGDADKAEPPRADREALGEVAGPLDKARDMQNTTIEHKRNLDAAIDATEGAADR